MMILPLLLPSIVSRKKQRGRCMLPVGKLKRWTRMMVADNLKHKYDGSIYWGVFYIDLLHHIIFFIMALDHFVQKHELNL
jgi:hypothetical protein